MKNILYTIILSLLFSSSVFADFQASQDAYEAGDHVAAFRLIKPLAEQGDARGQSALGYLYQQGKGVTQDYKEAVKWYRLAAEQGDVQAQYNLGVMFLKEQGVTRDFKEAAKWFRLAADQGFAVAQSNLGEMYANGTGVIQDVVISYMWFNIAAYNGYEDAKTNRDILEKLMTSEQIIKAQAFARKCVKKNYKDCGLIIECSNLDWSNDPGAYELHLIRRCANPYFSESRQVVSMEKLAEAKKIDDSDYELAKKRLFQLLKYLENLSDFVILSEFDKIREQMDDLIKFAGGVRGRANKIATDVDELRDDLIKLKMDSLSNDSQALLVLKRANDFHKEFVRKLLNSLTLQITRERSPIRVDEMIAVIISENPETIRNYLIVIPEDAQFLLKKGALLLMKDALDRGYLDNYFDEKIEVLSADYPDFYKEYNKKRYTNYY